jgi:hypothetical protein
MDRRRLPDLGSPARFPADILDGGIYETAVGPEELVFVARGDGGWLLYECEGWTDLHPPVASVDAAGFARGDDPGCADACLMAVLQAGAPLRYRGRACVRHPLPRLDVTPRPAPAPGSAAARRVHERAADILGARADHFREQVRHLLDLVTRPEAAPIPERTRAVGSLREAIRALTRYGVLADQFAEAAGRCGGFVAPPAAVAERPASTLG